MPLRQQKNRVAARSANPNQNKLRRSFGFTPRARPFPRLLRRNLFLAEVKPGAIVLDPALAAAFGDRLNMVGFPATTELNRISVAAASARLNIRPTFSAQ